MLLAAPQLRAQTCVFAGDTITAGLVFHNRGLSGDKLEGLAARWEQRVGAPATKQPGNHFKTASEPVPLPEG